MTSPYRVPSPIPPGPRPACDCQLPEIFYAAVVGPICTKECLEWRECMAEYKARLDLVQRNRSTMFL